jgi:hypothetical protein
VAIHADDASDALATGSVDGLIAGLRRCLIDHMGFPDERDVMLDFAPFYDAARRLRSEPQEVFDVASDGLAADVHDLARRFARRTEVTLAAFGWRLTDEGDGLRYRFAWPRWDPPSPPARPRE